MSRRYLTPARLDDLQAKLTFRDLAVLRSVSDLRFISGGQLTRRHFADAESPEANARAARRCLVRLLHLRLLARLPRQIGGVRSGSSGFVYRLDLAGQHLAMRLGWQLVRRPRRSQVPGTFFLAHALAVAELHTLLCEAARAGRFELLELVAEPACWRSWAGLGNRRRTLKPDSYLRLGLGAFEDSYFIEVDRGTEGSSTILGKLGDYVAYARSGQEQQRRGVFPRVLWTVPDEARGTVIEDGVRRLRKGDRGMFVVAELDAVLTTLAPET